MADHDQQPLAERNTPRRSRVGDYVWATIFLVIFAVMIGFATVQFVTPPENQQVVGLDPNTQNETPAPPR